VHVISQNFLKGLFSGSLPLKCLSLDTFHLSMSLSREGPELVCQAKGDYLHTGCYLLFLWSSKSPRLGFFLYSSVKSILSYCELLQWVLSNSSPFGTSPCFSTFTTGLVPGLLTAARDEGMPGDHLGLVPSSSTPSLPSVGS
jgi:hypothetical protein